MDILEQVSKKYNLIVKFHSKVFEGGQSIHLEMEHYVETHHLGENVRIIYDDNILPYMAKADLMISDMSSACYEWFHFNRPIVFANPSPENYRPVDDISSNTYSWQAGDVLYDKADILPTLERNFERDAYRETRNSIFEYSIYMPDGHATERQASQILALLRKNETGSFGGVIPPFLTDVKSRSLCG